MATQEETFPQHTEVFINFRGAELPFSFFSLLKRFLKRNGVTVHDDHRLIEESRIALVIFSSRYTESKRCLDELVKIKERVEEGKLVVIPLFYKLMVSEVRYLRGEFGDNFWDLTKDTSDDKIKEWKEALDSVSRRDGLGFNEKSDNEADFIDGIGDQVRIALIRTMDQIEKSHDYRLSEMQEDASIDSSRSEDLKGSDAKMNADFLDRTFTNSPMDGEVKPPKIQVFISFHGAQLRNSFIGYLAAALQRHGINVFIDTYTNKGEHLNNLFKRIEDSGIAIVVFSSRYTESKWLLEELVKIKERVEEGKLVVIPVFYKLMVSEVRYLWGEFGDNFWDLTEDTSDDKIIEWMEALDSVSRRDGLGFNEKSDNEADFIDSIIQQVIRTMDQIEKSHDYRLSEMQEDASIDSSRSEDLKGSDAKMNADFLDRTFTNSTMDGEVKPPKIQVFISFRGAQLRKSFIDPLAAALQRSGINVFIDTYMNRGEDLNNLFKRIEDSGIAIVVFSSWYTESKWLLEELVKIKELVEEGKLVVIPLFYNLMVYEVRYLRGKFGDSFRDLAKGTSDDKIKEWMEALDSISRRDGLRFNDKSNALIVINRIVKEVKSVMIRISLEKIEQSHERLSEQQEGVFMDYPSSEDLKGDDGERDGILWDRNPKEAEIVQPEAKSRRDDGLNPSKDDNFLGDTNSDATSKLKNSAEINKVDPVIVEKKQENVGESYTMVTYDKSHSEPPELFINFCGAELRHGFVGDLVEALKRDGIKIYIDLDELLCGGNEESRIALVIFSRRYTESRWCLNELVKIKELMEEGKLSVIPIFYKLEQLEVTQLKGDFGVKFWNLWRINRDNHIIKWKEALESFASSEGIYLKEHGSESKNITLTVKEVLRVSLHKGGNQSLSLSTEKGKRTDLPIGKGEKHETYLNKCHLFGMEQRMEQLERKLEFDCKETRIIGVVGMPGIGKTALAMMLHEKWSCKFIRSVPFLGIRKKSEQYEPEWLRKTLLEVLLEGTFPEISDKTTHEFVKVELLQKKIFAVLDDVSNKKQLDFLLGDLGWIKKGSKIVITTCDKSLLKALSHDNYVVPRLNYKESFNLFNYHAFDDQFCSPTKTFEELSRMFVECTRGHPLALKVLGRELCGRDKAYWEKKLKILRQSSNMLTQYVRRFSIDQLNDRQKDVFLDIVCFFNSEDEYFVKSLLGPGDSDSNDAVSEVIDLANKFLITVSDGRVEMNHLLYMFGKDLSSPERYRLWNYKNIINMPTEMEEPEANIVRGISVDMSKVAQIIPLQRMAFTNMLHLRYLKIYDSSCPPQCKAYCKLNFPDGLEFPLEEIRYLHWVRFPLKELPANFRPKNLVDLRLPYSKIKHVWEGVKDTPRLKWVDLNHSNKLLDLSALSKAENLQRLNLEGCTSLDELPLEIQNMKSLVFLNLRGCIGLCSLPNMNLISLKTLILSDCSNLEEFELISESVEFLHLDGTSIKGLPLSIQKLQRLVVLNLKNCKMLECIPECLGELKALEELILSGCSRLKNLSDVSESMKHRQSLLIDRIGAKEMPNISCVSEANDQASTDMFVEPMGPSKQPRSVYGVSSLRRLCLSGNDFVSLQPDIEILYNLKWLDVKHCKKLRCVPMLPPRLEYFDAHGCDLLERVANPLALQDLSEHIHATFNFSKCNKLDQDAKDSIISYTRWRSQLGLDELIRFNGGVVLEALIGTCLPGCEVPAWFSHQASGPVLEPKLPPHWCNNQFTGIALCAVISFHTYHERRNRLLVKCNCVFNKEDGSHIRFSCTIGSWSEPSSTQGTCEPSHVFIGYTSVLNIKQHGEEEVEEGCSHTNASFEFQVTDGTQVIGGCEVLKCGFSLVYATNERENICWDAKAVIIPENIENIPGEALSYGNSGSHDEYFVRSLLDSENPEAMSEVRDMADKFLILTFLGGRVEMHGQLHTLGKDLGSPGKRRLQNYKDIINTMTEMKQSEVDNVRGIFLDMSEITKSIALDCTIFAKMLNLRYLKIYDSYCPRKCKATCNLYFPDGVEFPLEDVRYLHWVKFPLQELPADFRPKNLVDLRLPYSNIERVWEGVKDAQRLKWVDLSHSSKLLDLSALSKAENLQRLNLEGCTSLDELPLEIQNMKSLVFLNLRGCIGICSLPNMNLISLKTLILSDCSNLEEFELISESVEFLHLDGTSIKGLPLAIKKLQRLVVLNLKNCKMLECIPECLGELKALEELILSGCSRLKNLSDVSESMKHLQSLLIDRVGAKEMPNISCVSEANDQASTDMSVEPMGPSKQPRSVNGVSSLRRLCLSGNDFVSLQPDIEILYNLKWLDVKHCKKLRCVPMLPPRLEYFDAHGCDSLERVANPLALQDLSEHIHATFNFSKCNKLDQDAKDSIISYTRWRSQLVLDEISRYNRGLVLEVLIGTCFPGWEVPSWFIHHASGSVLNLKLPPHWCDNRLTGIGLCAVIVFHGNHDQRKHVLVKCNCEFKNEDGCIIRFSCTVGGWSEPSNTPRNIESSHVFIGFTSKLDINKIAEEDDEEKCFSTETSINFQVTDGREEIKGSEVLKCGFSLLYAPEERRNICSGFKDL